MPKPGNVTVVTEVGYCPFCGRTRNLRREERHLGGLVRTNVECESCHRTLSSTMAPAQPEPAGLPEAPAPALTAAPEPEPAAATPAAKKPATTKKAATKKAAPIRKAATKKTA